MPSAKFKQSLTLPVTPEEAFAWHERPGALDRLIPPWEKVAIESRGQGIRNGSQVILKNSLGPFGLRWLAEHRNYRYGHHFSDVQLAGPFSKWEHWHRFQPHPDGCVLVDEIEYQIPGGAVSRRLLKPFVERKIARMFDFRHQTTLADIRTHAAHQEKGQLQIAISGSHGLVGSELLPLLTTGGHSAIRLVRNTGTSQDLLWDPHTTEFETAGLEGFDAVVHLAGENIAAGRWNRSRKDHILTSRVEGTRTISTILSQLKQPPKVLVTASAVGFYGSRGDTILDETSSPGDGFLANVAKQWEEATRPAREAGIRTVHLRFGMILSPKGGALVKILPPFQWAAGGIVGTGRQYWSWVALDDAAGMILHAIMNDSLHGPVNAVSPQPVTNLEFTQTLGHVLKRPTLLPMPSALARLAVGEMADELLLASARATPAKLLNAGYHFRHPQLQEALRGMLGR